jgi:hypothetical protein
MSKAQWLACSMVAVFCAVTGVTAVDQESWAALVDAVLVLAAAAYAVVTVRRNRR